MFNSIGRSFYGSVWKRLNPSTFDSLNTWSFTFASNSSDITSGLLRRNLPKPFSSSTRNGRQITRRFATGGFLVLGTSPNSSTAVVESGTSCALSSEKIISQHYRSGIRRQESFTKSIWRRSFHASRTKNAKQNPENEKGSLSPENDFRPKSQPTPRENIELKDTEYSQESSTQRNRVMERINYIHRPTREELLAAATGFWSRLKVRFKWFSIRSVRPFNMDEIGAFFSWILLGHVVWVIVGTTTFFSLLILAINTVFAQGKQAPITFAITASPH